MATATMIRQGFAMLLLGAAVLLQAQPAGSPGQISGTVVGDDGKPLAGVFVTYTRSPISPKDTVPASGGTTTDSTGAYSFGSLIPATYTLCPNAPPSGGLIMTCAWTLRTPVIVLQSGQQVSGNTIVMHKGTVLRIRVADPKNLAPVTDWMRGPTNLSTGVWTADGLFHPAHLRSGGATGGGSDGRNLYQTVNRCRHGTNNNDAHIARIAKFLVGLRCPDAFNDAR